LKRSSSTLNLISLARIARKKIEALSKEEGGQPHLGGYCGVAARYIEILANNVGLYPEFVVGHFKCYNRILDQYYNVSGHAWIEFEDNIIDITATQFRSAITKIDRDFNQKVYIAKNSNPHYAKDYIGHKAKETANMWYIEHIDDIVAKADRISI
jgi:hypothetical protein